MVTASGNVAQLWTNVDRLTRAGVLYACPIAPQAI
jgi:hypothetical protein